MSHIAILHRSSLVNVLLVYRVPRTMPRVDGVKTCDMENVLYFDHPAVDHATGTCGTCELATEKECGVVRPDPGGPVVSLLSHCRGLFTKITVGHHLGENKNNFPLRIDISFKIVAFKPAQDPAWDCYCSSTLK